ncbi:MAG: hypothetical protein K8R48_06540 [Alphaproteobacteria bacterium]|nr:hypothetical protein [Alphaproteobacteria bacterium]
MESKLSHAGHDYQAATASLDALRGQALSRLSGVQHSLESKGVGAAFIRAAKADPLGDMGLTGSLIMSMIMGVSTSGLLPAHFPVSAIFNYETISSALDGISILRDQVAEGYRGRKLDDYPEGRRKCALEAAGRMGKKFNLVSANQNHRLSFDAQADLACMYEIIDMLDRLENEGVRAIRIDQKESVYDSLKQTTRKAATGAVLRSGTEPMLMAS